MVQVQAREDLETLLKLLPAGIRAPLEELGREDELLEVVMDLGRPPTARYVDEEIIIRAAEVDHSEINQVIEGIGDFDDDNRAGIARTLAPYLRHPQPPRPGGRPHLPCGPCRLRHNRHHSRDRR